MGDARMEEGGLGNPDLEKRTWLDMRLDSLVSLVQASRSIDDVKGRVGPRVNPDLLQPRQVVKIIRISSSGNCLYNLRMILRN